LKALPTGLAAEVAHACLLVDFHRHRGFMVAEDTAKGCGKWLSLLGTGWLACRLLAFAHVVRGVVKSNKKACEVVDDRARRIAERGTQSGMSRV
jgi:hypothetical protein